MAKAEKKKSETQTRLDFIAKTYATVLSCVAEQTADVRTKVEFRVTHYNYNRYLHFHVYGRDMAILIYRDGKVALELKEFAHNDYTEQLFDYAEEAENQETFFERLREMCSWLIRLFMDKSFYDFHTYMDYVSENKNAEIAYQTMRAEFGR